MAVCLLLAAMAGVCSANVSILENPAIGVLPFKNKGIISPGWQREQMNQVTDIAYAELQNTKEFNNLLERDRLRDLTDEYALTKAGLVDSSTAVPIGNLTGAQYLLFGSINSVTARKSETSVAGLGTDRYKVTATVSMRIVDVETGRVALAAVGTGTARNTMVKGPLNLIRIGTADVDEQQVIESLQAAVHDAVQGKYGLVARIEGRAGR
jgi:curli biogenesis system outer membrane secretion channel CsgG